MSRTDLRWADVGDARVPYLELGDPGGPPVLLLPGLSDGLGPVSDPKARKALPELPRALRRFRVVMASHRHPVPERATTRALAADAVTFIERVMGGPTILSAHSMGAMVAQHVAADRPDLVRALTLSATVPYADGDLRRIIRRWDDLITAGRWRDFYGDALEVSFTGSDLLRRKLALRLLGAPARDHLVDRHLALSHACRTHDATDRLQAITCPTLVLAGDQDPIARVERAEQLRDGIRDAELVVLEGYAHGFPEQARDRYVDVLGPFLARVLSATGTGPSGSLG